MKKIVKDAAGITSKAVKLGFVGLGFGLGVANRALGSALDGIRENTIRPRAVHEDVPEVRGDKEKCKNI